mgnify:CR=1 FL=1
MSETIHVRDYIARDVAVEKEVVVQFREIPEAKKCYPDTNGNHMPEKLVVHQNVYNKGQHDQLNIFRKFNQVEICEIHPKLKIEISFQDLEYLL